MRQFFRIAAALTATITILYDEGDDQFASPDCGCLRSTDSTKKLKYTGLMKQLGQKKRQKSLFGSSRGHKIPSSTKLG